MKNKITLFLLFTLFLVSSCSQQQARKPISQSSGTFMKESIARNKKLVASEEDKIVAIMKSNPNINYIASKKGYWYYYETQNNNDVMSPKKGYIAYFDYEISDLNNNIIYSQLELRPQIYTVDKDQKIISGLRDGIKLMHKNEKITFLFPSHLAFGYHGDDRRIGINEPIICTVTLNDIKQDPSQNETQIISTNK
jgi:gliding motility-associated peptidyl-prolyl isomerase